MPKILADRFRALSDAIPVPLRFLTAAGNTNWVNAAWLSFVGELSGQTTDSAWEAVAHPNDVAACRTTISEAAVKCQSFTLEYRIRRTDHEDRWVRETAAPWAETAGVTAGYVCSITDITGERVLEQRVSGAENEKVDFLSAIVYQMGVRLSPVSDGLDLLDGPMPFPRRTRVRISVREQIGNVCALVGHLTDVVQIALGRVKLQRTRVSILGVLKASIAAIKPAVDVARQSVRHRLPDYSVSVIGDESRLFQAITFVLRFANEWTPEGGTISLTCTLDTGTVLVHIQDSGRSVAESRLARLFDLFAQRERHGRGVPPQLGYTLYTARRLVGMHDGTISAANADSELGLVITIRLPIAPDIGQGAFTAPLSGVPAPVG